MDELLEQFLIEGRDLVAQAASDFDVLARDPGDAGTIDSAFRAIHTLKGSVCIFPMGPAERVLHAAEDALERARKGKGALDAGAVAGLVACLDAVDRWIDEIERGAIGADAEQIAAKALARLPGTAAAPDAAETDTAPPDWLGPLAEREWQAIEAADRPLTAFRYAPDPACFFRGEDPLAIAAEVPELLTLAILPAEGAWPSLEAIEPFACVSVLEGLSAAPIDAMRAAFRMVPDRIALHRIDPATADTAPAEAAGRTNAMLRVDAARVDALADGLGELVVAVNGFAALAERAEAIDRTLAAGIRTVQADIERVAGELHRSVSAVRLVPLAPTLRRLPRVAREIAAALGKQVDFIISSEGLEVDKQIADGLFEPLLHLIRNAIDHGIETPDARAAAGKPVEGRVTLAVAREGDAIRITLDDDGAGIDPARIRTAAVSRGVIGEEAAAKLSDPAALRLIFAPGFSTAPEVTAVSGRGVGMDAVQAAVERLRGTIDLAGEPGRGTRFALRLPANALTTRLLVVEAGGDRYGVALDQIVETFRVDAAALMPVGSGAACVLRGHTVPVLSLAALLGGSDTPSATAKLLVTRAAGERVALKVDGFAERIDALVRPPGGILSSVPGVTGSALLGDGGVLLVLDLPALAA
ncbi:chemotaxis protein CheA [Sphingomonas sp. HF-S4]|uniref:histidine kinase n=1 Tax=Sphingomonas agrestis TaxID=3080540 RepID=A0ABU3Y3W1_9SPHN|nr:chemotaxis protein CheA [Sphingomonas sp. HF-S4]MDV3456043.1 chemotaxis protein CheA [Sphingomonas sp. HF-S4]